MVTGPACGHLHGGDVTGVGVWVPVQWPWIWGLEGGPLWVSHSACARGAGQPAAVLSREPEMREQSCCLLGSTEQAKQALGLGVPWGGLLAAVVVGSVTEVLLGSPVAKAARAPSTGPQAHSGACHVAGVAGPPSSLILAASSVFADLVSPSVVSAKFFSFVVPPCYCRFLIGLFSPPKAIFICE